MLLQSASLIIQRDKIPKTCNISVELCMVIFVTVVAYPNGKCLPTLKTTLQHSVAPHVPTFPIWADDTCTGQLLSYKVAELWVPGNKIVFRMIYIHKNDKLWNTNYVLSSFLS